MRPSIISPAALRRPMSNILAGDFFETQAGRASAVRGADAAAASVLRRVKSAVKNPSLNCQ
jgi:hypothetical protein